MKKILGLFAICLSFTAFAGNNDIYITQTGTGLTLTIDQIGASNTIGTTGARATLSGTSLLQGNSSSFTYSVTGDSNAATLAVGATGDTAGSDFDYITIGDSNVLYWTQGASSTATGGNQDFVIAGTSNSVTGICEVVGCINSWDIDGNSNTITTLQTGQSDHQITADLTGSSNTITVDQTDITSTNVLNIISTTSNGIIDVDQCASGC